MAPATTAPKERRLAGVFAKTPKAVPKPDPEPEQENADPPSPDMIAKPIAAVPEAAADEDETHSQDSNPRPEGVDETGEAAADEQQEDEAPEDEPQQQQQEEEDDQPQQEDEDEAQQQDDTEDAEQQQQESQDGHPQQDDPASDHEADTKMADPPSPVAPLPPAAAPAGRTSRDRKPVKPITELASRTPPKGPVVVPKNPEKASTTTLMKERAENTKQAAAASSKGGKRPASPETLSSPPTTKKSRSTPKPKKDAAHRSPSPPPTIAAAAAPTRVADFSDDEAPAVTHVGDNSDDDGDAHMRGVDDSDVPDVEEVAPKPKKHQQQEEKSSRAPVAHHQEATTSSAPVVAAAPMEDEPLSILQQDMVDEADAFASFWGGLDASTRDAIMSAYTTSTTGVSMQVHKDKMITAGFHNALQAFKILGEGEDTIVIPRHLMLLILDSTWADATTAMIDADFGRNLTSHTPSKSEIAISAFRALLHAPIIETSVEMQEQEKRRFANSMARDFVYGPVIPLTKEDASALGGLIYTAMQSLAQSPFKARAAKLDDVIRRISGLRSIGCSVTGMMTLALRKEMCLSVLSHLASFPMKKIVAVVSPMGPNFPDTHPAVQILRTCLSALSSLDQAPPESSSRTAKGGSRKRSQAAQDGDEDEDEPDDEFDDVASVSGDTAPTAGASGVEKFSTESAIYTNHIQISLVWLAISIGVRNNCLGRLLTRIDQGATVMDSGDAEFQTTILEQRQLSILSSTQFGRCATLITNAHEMRRVVGKAAAKVTKINAEGGAINITEFALEHFAECISKGGLQSKPMEFLKALQPLLGIFHKTLIAFLELMSAGADISEQCRSRLLARIASGRNFDNSLQGSKGSKVGTYDKMKLFFSEKRELPTHGPELAQLLASADLSDVVPTVDELRPYGKALAPKAGELDALAKTHPNLNKTLRRLEKDKKITQALDLYNLIELLGGYIICKLAVNKAIPATATAAATAAAKPPTVGRL